MNKIKTIVLKEWAEVFKNRMVLFTILFMPLLFTALPLIILYATRDAGLSDLSSEMPPQFTQLCPEGMRPGVCFQVYMTSQFMLLFMMMPLIIPVNIAAYSIVGEKTTRSLEPLLATPISTAELLSGKNLAAVIPAVLATWLGFAIYAIGSVIIASDPQLVQALLDARWLAAIGIVGPLMAVLSVNFSLMVSSRVNDPRVAEQLSAVVILPVLLLFFGQISGFLIFNLNLVLVLAVIVAILDVVLVYVSVKMFQRETILTRWK
jgi:ABC-2 type transport system permease protein